MELVDRYVHQVGRRLPKRLRDDVKVELRSLLLDALEERTGLEAGDETTFSEEDQVAVLEEFGPPAQMAAKYQLQPRYVIGPQVYNLYLIVVAVVIGAGLLASIVSTAVSGLHAGSARVEILELLGQGLVRFFNIAISGIGSTTLIFAVLERAIPNGEFELDDEKEWSPHDLPEIEESDEIKHAGLIVQIGILALLLIAFIGFPDRIATGAYYDYGWHIVPSILSPAFFSIYLPLIEISWGLTIILNLVLLRQGRWQLGTRIANLLIQGFDVFILARLLLGPSILNANVLNGMFPVTQYMPASPVDSALRLAFLVALIVTVIETVVKIWRTWQSRARATLPLSDVQKSVSR
ncbi:MAG: hypothetical protein SWK90_14875 [Chloroflexota bacterium]|nr:hypothetical protein [Chloroflexota bacterium]